MPLRFLLPQHNPSHGRIVRATLAKAGVIERKLNRRLVLQAGAAAAGGLLIGAVLPRLRGRAATGPIHSMLTRWLRIAPDDFVTMMIPRAEMGQAITTSLPMLIAKELEIDWRKVQFDFAPANSAYVNPISHMQATSGSTSIRAFYSPLRQVGAAARIMLCQAAAAKWGVPVSECSAANGRISHSSGQSENYGALADAPLNCRYRSM
jgi:isoquinoline 1-oxidoreductase beta subunit